jgi:hypothetical protein
MCHRQTLLWGIQSHDDKSGTVGSRTLPVFYRARSSMKVGEMAIMSKTKNRARAKRLHAAMPEWKRREYGVAYVLRKKGVRCRRVGGVRSPFDILTAGGLRLEIKSAEYKPKRKTWTVSLARNGRMTESKVDYYIFALSMSGFAGFRHKRLYVIVKSPVQTKQVVFTIHRLLTRWKDNVDAWSLIADAEKV